MANFGIKRKFLCKNTSAEKTQFTWEISNFRELIATNIEMTDVAYSFEAGYNFGIPSTWKVFLRKTENKLGIFIEIIKTLEESISASFHYKTVKRARKFPNRKKFKLNQARGWEDCFFSFDDLTEDNLENGSLVINITFFIYNKQLVDGKYKRGKLESQSRHDATEDFQKLLDSGENADVTIHMNDGQILKAHSNILKARSPMLSAMLQTPMREALSGTIHILDVTSEVMKRILTFIYSGKVEDHWEDVIEELVHAADKYALLSLLKFCDENLATTCTPENAWYLMDLAIAHRLKRAKVEIAEYFKIHVSEILAAKVRD